MTHTRTVSGQLGAAALAALLLGATLAGCVDEDKIGCQTHADCAGVRQCKDGACFTPAAFAGDAYGPRYADEPAEDSDDDVDGAVVLPLSPDPGFEGSLHNVVLEVDTIDIDAANATILFTGRRRGGDPLVWEAKALSEDDLDWLAMLDLPAPLRVIDLKGEGLRLIPEIGP